MMRSFGRINLCFSGLFSFSYVRDVFGTSGGSDGKESDCNAGDPGLIPGSGRSSEEGHGNPLEYSCLENPLRQRSLQATAQGVAQSQTRLSD